MNAVKKSYICFLISLVLFGSNGVVASEIALNSYEIVLLRTVIGCAFLMLLFFVTGHKITVFSHKMDGLLICLSGVAMAANWLCLFEAYAEIGVSLGMLINYGGPAIVVALSPLLFRERLSLPKALSLLAALFGVFFIGGGAVTTGVSVGGLFFAGLSAVFYAIMIILNKLARNVTGMENALWQLVSAAVVVVLFVGVKQGLVLSVAVTDWLPIAWIGVVNTGIGCFLYFSSFSHLPAQTVAVCGYAEPVCAVVFSVLLLHEQLLPIQILGAVLIIGGAICGECLRLPHKKTE